MKKFLNRIFKFLNPELFATTERFEECNWWSNKCTEAYNLAKIAADKKDWDAFNIHQRQHELLSRKFQEAMDRFHQGL